jgi:hypothetical protein
VYNDYGYEPKRGGAVTVNSKVYGSQFRIIYVPPVNKNAPVGKWADFTYTVNDGSSTSKQGIVTLVSSDKWIVGSKFDNDVEGWTIVGNGVGGAGVTFEASSRGPLNHYIWSKESEINVDDKGSDKDQWQFVAPSKFLGNKVISYGGELSFWMSSASGDFSSAANRNGGENLVELVCDSCASQTGVRLVRRLSAGTPFTGAPTLMSIPLSESAWLKDTKNSLIPFAPPTQCELVEVLEGLTSIRILGDFTKWYESVSIDSVNIKHGSGVPIACYSILH